MWFWMCWRSRWSSRRKRRTEQVIWGVLEVEVEFKEEEEEEQVIWWALQVEVEFKEEEE